MDQLLRDLLGRLGASDTVGLSGNLIRKIWPMIRLIGR